MIGASAHDAGTEPSETRAGSDGVGFTFNFPGAVRGKELAEIICRPAANTYSAVWKLIRPHALLELLLGIQWRLGLKHDNTEAAFGQDTCGGSSRRAGADDANVVTQRSTTRLAPWW